MAPSATGDDPGRRAMRRPAGRVEATDARPRLTPHRRTARRGERHRPTERSLTATHGLRDGSQAVPDLSADEVLDALSDDLMAEGDLEAALRRLFERGGAPPARPWHHGRPP